MPDVVTDKPLLLNTASQYSRTTAVQPHCVAVTFNARARQVSREGLARVGLPFWEAIPKQYRSSLGFGTDLVGQPQETMVSC